MRLRKLKKIIKRDPQLYLLYKSALLWNKQARKLWFDRDLAFLCNKYWLFNYSKIFYSIPNYKNLEQGLDILLIDNMLRLFNGLNISL